MSPRSAPAEARGPDAPAPAGTPAPPRHPAHSYPPYRSSEHRVPRHPAVPVLDPEAVELTGPVFGVTDVAPMDSDLTSHHTGAPLGERITVSGRVTDRDGRPVRGQLVELWQANAAGRYAHRLDRHQAPLDPNFTGFGRCLTDDDGGYAFTTIRPGAYPWRNHVNAWRPAHLHFSVFGTAFAQRLVTQMYFPGDPLLAYDPVLGGIPDATARQRLVAAYDHGLTVPEWALGYRWDIVLDGPSATPFEEPGGSEEPAGSGRGAAR
ncbi:protocatechuate 3,4-dioxygenase subunit beta [Streptomyces sp. G45]|uniref:protocatechuate 3,4-dioxygenase subunit beta n=1 Tax=Streptomyces sp. G45 TaxID=3406627 RepID=UPI003C1661BA